MEEWTYEKGKLQYKKNSILVTVASKNEEEDSIKKLKDLPNYLEFKDLGLSPYLFYEWRTYIVKIEENGNRVRPERAKVCFGEDEAEFNKHGFFWEYEFRNYIGKSELKIILDNRELLTLEIEVLSPKLSLEKGDEIYYPDFYRALIESLERNLLTPCIEIISPTYLRTKDRPGPYNLLVLYHQLLEVYKTLRESVRTIIANPHKDLTIAEEYVELNEVETVNPEACLSIFQNPSLLVKSELTNTQLCSKLKGYLPKKVLQYRKIETFDTPENRFVKKFLVDLITHITRIKSKYGEKLKEGGVLAREALAKLTNLKGELEMALLGECFQGINEADRILPLHSQVLLKKDGYREILQVYNKLLLSKESHPFFRYFQEKISQRNIAEMYEFWCFFELTKKLANILGGGKMDYKIRTSWEGGLSPWTKSIIGDYELIYNKKFERGKQGSYSVPLIPDFSLQKAGKILAVFDSKFRFREVEEDAEEIEKAIERGEIERIASASDIYKMHTYKDALKAKFAFILYPGNRNIFYSKKSEDSRKYTLEEILRKIFEEEEEGVGYLCFIPRLIDSS